MVSAMVECPGTPVPLYTGTMRTVANDNDLEVSLTRTNSFGARSTGWVEDADRNRCRFQRTHPPADPPRRGVPGAHGGNHHRVLIRGARHSDW